MRNLAALMLLGVSGVVLAQGAQQGGSAQPRQQQGVQQGGASESGARQSQRSPGAQQSQVPSFDSLDSNRDGQLSRTEANAIDGFDFAKADVNQNASVDRQEYMAAMSDAQSDSPRPGAGSRSGSSTESDSSSAPRQTR